MLRRSNNLLGAVAATALAAAGLIVVPAAPASAGVECTTKVDNVPIRVSPKTGSPVASRVPHAGTPFGCSGGPDWFRLQRLDNGRWVGYVGARFMDTSAG